jgi:hypothetical protein
MSTVRLIGYWWSGQHPEWPNPAEFIDSEWDATEREMVGWYLRSGQVASVQAGLSRCRICGTANGSAELTDGVYLWPEGLGHYVDAHAVRLPREVIAHIRQQTISVDSDAVDREWWKSVRPD